MPSIITLPGLIDPHVHLRDPGQTHKEDFYTGTCAALAGGYTTVIDMPNNQIAVTTKNVLTEKIKIARGKIVCDVGFHFGSLGDNLSEFPHVLDYVRGIKLYLNMTTGKFLIDKPKVEAIFKAWPGKKPILVHAEADVIHFVMELVKKTGKKTHVCHVSSQEELEPIINAKEKGFPVTCGVTPHHLFLTEDDVKKLGPFGVMKPSLKSKHDQKFLWKNLKYIDVIESDHAPHTKKEKGEGVFGVPGLETTLPLLLTAKDEGKLTVDDIIEKCHVNPARIFNVKTNKNTYVEILNSSFIIRNSELKTKCGWSPFDGWKVRGKVVRVIIRGTQVFGNGKILAKPGSGEVL